MNLLEFATLHIESGLGEEVCSLSMEENLMLKKLLTKRISNFQVLSQSPEKGMSQSSDFHFNSMRYLIFNYCLSTVLKPCYQGIKENYL